MSVSFSIPGTAVISFVCVYVCVCVCVCVCVIFSMMLRLRRLIIRSMTNDFSITTTY